MPGLARRVAPARAHASNRRGLLPAERFRKKTGERVDSEARSSYFGLSLQGFYQSERHH
jgi:hypothetical protein